jgi:HlyD family secretion protein
MKQIIGLVVLAAFVTGVYVANKAAKRSDGKSILHVAPALEMTVETASPVQKSIVRAVQAPGEVEALDEVDISAEVVAKILEMPVEEGDAVKKGDLLCRLDDADYRARLTSAKANIAKLEASLEQAEADLEKANRDFDRQKKLSEADATSSTELADYLTIRTRAKTVLAMRKQEIVEAHAQLQSAEEDLEKTVIKAPIDGVISQLFAEQGEVVITGTMNNPGTRIMVISDLSKMQVRCRVDETDAPLVKPNQIARLFLQSETRTPIAGHVVRVATKGSKPLGRDVVSFETLVLVDSNDQRVKPGMTASVEIEVARREDAVTVPVQAVVHRKRRDLPAELVEKLDEWQAALSPDNRKKTAEYIKVLFCSKNGVAKPVLVETGISDETSVEIVKGITTEDTVVIGPYRSLDQLKDGTKVKLDEEKGAPKKDGDDAAKPSGEAVAQNSAGGSGSSN